MDKVLVVIYSVALVKLFKVELKILKYDGQRSRYPRQARAASRRGGCGRGGGAPSRIGKFFHFKIKIKANREHFHSSNQQIEVQQIHYIYVMTAAK